MNDQQIPEDVFVAPQCEAHGPTQNGGHVFLFHEGDLWRCVQCGVEETLWRKETGRELPAPSPDENG